MVDETSKPSGLGIKLGSIILLIVLILGILVAGYFIYYSVSGSSLPFQEQNPVTPGIDSNDSDTPDANINPDTNTALPAILTPPTPITEQKPKLTITADNKSKNKDARDPTLTVSYSGFQSGDSTSILSGTLLITREPGEKVGTYKITASGLASTKYDINYVSGIFTIKSKSSSSSDSGPKTTETDPCKNLGVVTFIPNSGIYNQQISVALSYSGNSDCTSKVIRYSTDLSIPTINSEIYTSPIVIPINTSKSIKAAVFAKNKDGQDVNGSVTTNLYIINPNPGAVSIPQANYDSNIYYNDINLTLTTSTPDSNIYYNINNSNNPSCSDNSNKTLYTGQIPITTDTTLKAIACKVGFTPSNIMTKTYTMKVTAPTILPNPETSNLGVSVTITSNTKGSEIRYTNNNIQPSCSSTLYTGPITINATTKLRAIACKTNWASSLETSKNYPVLKVEKPTATPVGGQVTSGTQVTLNTSTAGANIRYTINNTDPTCSGTPYQNPITINTNTVLKAIACKDKWTPSDIMTENYTISQTPPPEEETWLWAKKAGGSAADDYAVVATDVSGNTYVAGVFSGNITIGNQELVSAGQRDSFVAKMDAEGSWQWANKIGGIYEDNVAAIKVDADSKVYIAGSFSSTTISFGSTTLTNTKKGYKDLFVAKLDSEGNWLWANNGGGTHMDAGQDLDVDLSGNVYVTGSSRSTGNYGGLPLNGFGALDIFVGKLNSSGQWVWVRNAGGNGVETGIGIRVDNLGNSYLAGNFASAIADFNNSANSGFSLINSQESTSDVFVAKISSDGTWLWVAQGGGQSSDGGSAIDLDSTGNIYVTGYCMNTSKFGATSISCSGNSDIFVAKMHNNNGNWIWAVKAGGSGIDISRSIKVNSNGNLYVCGEFGNTSSFGNINISSVDTKNAFIAKMNCAGNNHEWVFAEGIGGSGTDVCQGIAIHSSGITLSGIFSGNITVGNTQLISSGETDIFVAKMSD